MEEENVLEMRIEANVSMKLPKKIMDSIVEMGRDSIKKMYMHRRGDVPSEEEQEKITNQLIKDNIREGFEKSVEDRKNMGKMELLNKEDEDKNK